MVKYIIKSSKMYGVYEVTGKVYQTISAWIIRLEGVNTFAVKRGEADRFHKLVTSSQRKENEKARNECL